MFWRDGEAYLIAHRNVSETGSFDLMRMDVDPKSRVLAYHIDYLTRPKRCAIWRYVASADRIAFVTDLPSRGDTCFPGWLPGPDADTVVVYNYSSDLAGPDLTWAEGQRAPTFIYRHLVRFRAR